MTVFSLLDTVLDRSVVAGFSTIGYAVRRRLPSWPADPPPGALRGRVALVTGASSGLGMATAESLGRLGADVHLVVRDVAKGKQVAQRLRADVAAAAGFSVWRGDLADLDDVRRLSAELSTGLERLDVLVHNAGALPAERTESPQGHEQTMAVHVLGPVLLTEGVRPLLGEDARVILVTSGGMYTQRLRSDDPDYRRGDYSGTTAYARSKRAQVELLPELSRRWAPVGVYAMHPGWADTPGVSSSLPMFRRVTRPILRDAAAGADTTVWLAATQPPPRTGTLWHDRQERSTSMMRRTRPSEQDRAQMWAWVCAAAGLTDG